MPSRSGVSASFAAWTAQRVEVFLALSDPAGGLATLAAEPGRPARLPGVVLAHGEHPRDAALRAAGAPATPRGAAAGVGAPRSAPESAPGGAAGALVPERGGLRLHRVLSEVRSLPGHPGLHVLRLVFEPGRGLPLPVDESQLISAEPAPVTDDVPDALPRVQRPAAYVLVVRDGEVLLTRLVGGVLWTLPGGGIDHGEHPDAAVRREMIEETGLELTSAELADVDSQHITGHSPRAVLEDFHGVRLLYRGTVESRRTPAVQEIGGTTEAAAWWPLGELGRLRLTSAVRTALALLT